MIRIAYDNYLRELQDLLFTRDQLSLLVDELGSIIDPPNLTPSMKDVEQFMWNYHPRTTTASSWNHHLGAFYRNPATRTSSGGGWSYTRWLARDDIDGMKNFYKDFTAPPAGAVTTHDSSWTHWNGWEGVDAEFSDSGIPDAPTIQYIGVPGYPGNALIFQTSPFSDSSGSFAALKWRVAEVKPYSPPVINSASESSLRSDYDERFGTIGPMGPVDTWELDNERFLETHSETLPPWSNVP